MKRPVTFLLVASLLASASAFADYVARVGNEDPPGGRRPTIAAMTVVATTRAATTEAAATMVAVTVAATTSRQRPWWQ